MIGRSFTSLEAVFDIIRLSEQLGPIDKDDSKRLLKNIYPYSKSKADINLNRPNAWYGSGTFACWLPEAVDPSITRKEFDDAHIALSNDFYFRLERMEMHYRKFFDISEADFNSDVQRGERDVRNGARED
jgi:hypothetical protein